MHASVFSASTAFALALLSAAPLRAEEAKHVTAALVSESAAAVPGKPLQVGLHLKLEPHWHVYWKNPGDAGLPVSLDWKLPEGYKAGAIQWPYPERIIVPPLMNYGYENEVLLPVTVDVPKGAAGTVALAAKAKWVVCKEICLPGNAELSLELPVAAGGAASASNPANAAVFTAARAAHPAASNAWKFSAMAAGDSIVLIAQAPNGAKLAGLSFFPAENEIIDNAAPQKFYPIAGGYALTLKAAPPEEEGAKGPESLSGVAVAEPDWGPDKAVEVAVKILRGKPIPKATGAAVEVVGKSAPPDEGGAGDASKGGGLTGAASAIALPGAAVAPSATPATPAAPAPAGIKTLLLALFGAFVGGLILNLMPCVLPVLSLKIFDFVKRAGESRWLVFSHGLIFTAGVLISFWSLAGVLLILRSTGAGLGWGFQLQSPVFLMILCVLFTFFALSLFGVFEIGATFTRLGGAQSKDGWSGSFLAGVTATVVATPCTAPYMGSAMGYAFTQPAYFAMLVFTFVGLGMASPYIVLSGFPGLLKFLPKPGAWMETLKQFMGFPLLATAIWLAWVLGQQAGVDALIALLFLLLLSGMAAWILGKWTPLYQSGRTRVLGTLGAALVFLPAFFYVLSHLDNFRAEKPHAVTAEGGGAAMMDHGIAWETFSEERLAEALAQGKPVFVDFTADWCLSCKVNERVAFSSKEVQAKFKELGIVALKADWTLRDDKIARVLAGYGRNSIPLYVVYSADGKKDYTLLPEVLSAGIILQALRGVVVSKV